MDNVKDRQFIDVSGFKIHFQRMGLGEPVFTLLHGFGASLFSWREVIEPISRLGSVIAYDRLGFGFSSRPLNVGSMAENPYGAKTQVEILFNLLDSLGVDKTILVGHSAGGLLALQAAILRPERIQALVLVAPAVMRTEFMPEWVKPVFYLKPSRSILMPLTRGFLNRADGFLAKAWYDQSKITEVVKEGYFSPLKETGASEGLFWFMAAPGNPLADAKIAGIRMPTLVIHGENDRVIPVQTGQRIARLITGAVFHQVAACGHLPHEEKPDEFMSALEIFIQTIMQ